MAAAGLSVLIALLFVFGQASNREHSDGSAPPYVAVMGTGETVAVDRLHDIFRARAAALVAGDPAWLELFYAADLEYGKEALEREIRRIDYVQAWSQRRGVRLVLSETALDVITFESGPDLVRAAVVVSLGLGYIYDDDTSGRIQRFGIGTRQQIELVRRGDTWVIGRDVYTDPLDEDTGIPFVEPAVAGLSAWDWIGVAMSTPICSGAPMSAAGSMDWVVGAGSEDSSGNARSLVADNSYVSSASSGNVAPPGAYDRAAAIRYANRYCGAAWGCETGAYHPSYRDYNGIGGDCTNYVSQVLGDEEGGKLPHDDTWYYRGGSEGGGSVAWVRTDALVDHLVRNNFATVVAKGVYHDVAQPFAGSPHGLIGALEPGDIVGYEDKGRLVHLAVVVGKDHRGYVLVNSHTADRYHVPWDLGWDRSTVYWLVRMH